ncbi:MAG: chloramphenicol-sensitive protein RarD [Paracoccaceae bacterium]|jgi:chloramphenicol-sensitive protein RarD
MTTGAKGVFAMIAACCLWGLSSLYFKAAAHIPAVDMLAHRTVWSFVFFAFVLFWQGRLKTLPAFLGRHGGVVFLAAITISVNWFLFIYAVQSGQAVQASLGYYIFPLVAVLLGALFFGERLGRLQWVAVVLAGGAVVVLTVGAAVVPVLSLALACSFGVYGVLKKRLSAGPVESVAGEVFLVAPIGICWLGWTYSSGNSAVPDLRDLGLLALSGPLTAVPLILFSYASRRVRMATVGLVQYLNPTLQFVCAVLVFGEPFTGWHGVAFSLIWVALAIYSWQTLSEDRAARKARIKVSISGTSVM